MFMLLLAEGLEFSQLCLKPLAIVPNLIPKAAWGLQNTYSKATPGAFIKAIFCFHVAWSSC
jgi:hypothetical protein